MISLRYGFLCQYAVYGAGSMPCATHIFDSCQPSEPASPPLCMVLMIDASSDEAPKHLLTFELRDDDGGLVYKEEHPLPLGRRADGMGYSALMISQMGPKEVFAFGHYEWAVLVGGRLIGTLPLAIIAPKSASAPA